VRIFVSVNPKDLASADALQRGVSGIEPGTQVFFSRTRLSGWLPKLADEIAQADGFVLLIGPYGLGPWQEIEYFSAFDRHVNDHSFGLVAVIVGEGNAPGLPFLRNFSWIEAPVITEKGVLCPPRCEARFPSRHPSADRTFACRL
jgi:hypothetical protein